MIVSAVDSIATDKYCFFIKVLPAFLYGGNKDYHNIELFQQSLWGNISYIENEKTHFHLSIFPCFHVSIFPALRYPDLYPLKTSALKLQHKRLTF